MPRDPATPSTVTANAYRLAKTDTEHCIAMWAACELMSLHDKRSESLSEYANSWAKKAQTARNY